MIAVLLHDGFYGCGTGAGMSNRRFLEALTPHLAAGCRLVVMPVWVAQHSSEYDPRWHQAVEAMVSAAGGTVSPLDNGAAGLRRFGSVVNWHQLAASAEEQLAKLGLDQESLVVAFDVPFLRLPGLLDGSEAAVVFVPRGSLALHRLVGREVEWELGCYQRMLGCGTRIGLISEFMGRHLATRCRVPAAAMIPVYDGITEAEWSEEVLPIALPASAEREFLLTMGRAHVDKGFEDVLDALLVLRRRRNEIPHVVMAAVTEEYKPSAYQRHLQRRIAAEKLDVTLMTRFSPRVRSLIGHPALRTVVVPSRVEPFGRIPMEVYAHPTADAPVVAARVGGLSEVVIDGRTGFSFRPGSAEALAEAIARALRASGGERATLRSAGRQLINERYRYEVNVAAFLRRVAPVAAVPRQIPVTIAPRL